MALPVLRFIRKEITKQVSYELHALRAIKIFLMLIDLTQQATISRKSPIYWTDRMLQCSQKQKGEHHHGTYS